MAKKPKTETEGEALGDAQASTATSQSLQIQGLTFIAPSPYAEGHPLTANEAIALNGLLGENLRNNFAKQVKGAKEEAAKTRGAEAELTSEEVSALTEAFATYAGSYSFHGRTAPKVHVDPVKREAAKLAKAAITAALAAKSPPMAVKDLPEGRLDELVESLLAKDSRYTDEAKRRIAEAKSFASVTLPELELSQAQAAE